MRKMAACKNLDQIKQAVKNGRTPFLYGDFIVNVDSSTPGLKEIVVSSGSPRIGVWGTSKVKIRAINSSTPKVNLYDSSRVEIKSEDKSFVDVWGRDFLSLHVTAKGSSRVNVENCCCVKAVLKNASKNSRILCCGPFLGDALAESPKNWCDFYSVPIVDGIALLGKCVSKAYSSDRTSTLTHKPVFYTPGTIPVADDWDGGELECGKGLHFSPNVKMARNFAADIIFNQLVCPVKLEDMAVHFNGHLPQKCKAKGCCEPIWEVDEEGEPLRSTDKKIRDKFFKKHGKSAKKGKK